MDPKQISKLLHNKAYSNAHEHRIATNIDYQKYLLLQTFAQTGRNECAWSFLDIHSNLQSLFPVQTATK